MNIDKVLPFLAIRIMIGALIIIPATPAITPISIAPLAVLPAGTPARSAQGG